MKQYAIASLLLLGLSAPAFAAAAANQDATDTAPNFHYNAKDHWAIVDTVGTCGVVDAKPSDRDISGLKVLGDKSGYSSMSAANNELKSDKSACKSVIDRT